MCFLNGRPLRAPGPARPRRRPIGGAPPQCPALSTPSGSLAPRRCAHGGLARAARSPPACRVRHLMDCQVFPFLSLRLYDCHLAPGSQNISREGGGGGRGGGSQPPPSFAVRTRASVRPGRLRSTRGRPPPCITSPALNLQRPPPQAGRHDVPAPGGARRGAALRSGGGAPVCRDGRGAAAPGCPCFVLVAPMPTARRAPCPALLGRLLPPPRPHAPAPVSSCPRPRSPNSGSRFPL